MAAAPDGSITVELVFHPRAAGPWHTAMAEIVESCRPERWRALNPLDDIALFAPCRGVTHCGGPRSIAMPPAYRPTSTQLITCRAGLNVGGWLGGLGTQGLQFHIYGSYMAS